MTETEKHTIAKSFPDRFDQAPLGIEISLSAFSNFQHGIFARDMDSKWNVFVVDDILYLACSWTKFCIYRVFTQQEGEKVTLLGFQVNRDSNQYKGSDIDDDSALLRTLLQMFLNREDFYIDPKLELPLIKNTIDHIDPNNVCKKSIGSNNVGLTRDIHNALNTAEQKMYLDLNGWEALRKRIANKSDSEPMISLYLQNRFTDASTTFYFDKDATELLGQITITRKQREG